MIYKILYFFSPSEFELFIESTAPFSKSRKISSLIRKNGSIERDELFKRTFKQNRNVENDYLLRNEMSILKRKLENFIVSNSETDIPSYIVYHKFYVLTQWCLKKHLIKDAECYLDKAVSMAKNAEDWFGLLKMNRLQLHIIQQGKSDFYQKLKKMEMLSENHEEYLQHVFSDETRYVDFIRAGAYKLATNLRREVKKPVFPISRTVYLSEAKTSLAKYYHLKSLAYAGSGEEAISNLNAALTVLDGSFELYTKEEEKLTCLAAQAMEYGLLGNHFESARLYDQIIANPTFEYFGSRNALLFNYCTTLLKLKEYKRALFYLEALEQLEMEPIIRERVYSMKCNCYIFMEDLKGLKPILPKNLQSFDLSLRVYYRFLYLIYYLIKEDDTMANRELANIKQIKDLGKTDYLPLLNLFVRYMEAIAALRYKEPNTAKKIQRLKIELESLHPATAGLLPAGWVMEKSSQIMKI